MITLLGISNTDEDPGFCREFSYGWTRAFDAAAAVVAPSLVGQPLVGGWAGLYENTPDHNAMIGKAAVPGVLYATGFSGQILRLNKDGKAVAMMGQPGPGTTLGNFGEAHYMAIASNSKSAFRGTTSQSRFACIM